MAGDEANKVLKYGLVQDGKIIEEGILSEKEGITVGSDPSNTITIAEGKIPRKHRLIEPRGKHYKLLLFKGLVGKVSIGNKVYSVQEIESSDFGVKKGGYTEVELSVKSKGKLLFGKTTILFQLIPPPPPPPILKLPKELKANIWSGIDLFFITIVLLSALFHISLVAYMNSIERSDTLGSEDIAELTKQIISYDDVELIEDPPEDEALKETKSTKAGGGGGPKEEKEKGVGDRGLVALITKMSKTGGSVADIIGEGSNEDLGSAIGKFSGLEVAGKGNVGLRKGGGDGTGSGSSVNVGDLGSYSPLSSKGTGTRVERKVKSRVGSAPGGVTGKIAPASVYSVIRSRIGGVKYCYEKQLKTNPALAGKIRVQFVIGGSGSVSSCSVVANSLGNTSVQLCVCRMVRRWKFPPPDEGTVTVGYTFIFSAVSGG